MSVNYQCGIKRRLVGLKDWGLNAFLLLSLCLVIWCCYSLKSDTNGIARHKQPYAQINYDEVKISNKNTRDNYGPKKGSNKNFQDNDDLKINSKNTRDNDDLKVNNKNSRDNDDHKVKNKNTRDNGDFKVNNKNSRDNDDLKVNNKNTRDNYDLRGSNKNARDNNDLRVSNKNAQGNYGVKEVSSKYDLKKVSNKPFQGNKESLKVLNNKANDYIKPKKGSNKQEQRLPQCLIIGVRKGGTAALITFLNLHPDIVTAKNEMHFFENDANYIKGLPYYRKQMPLSYEDQLTIEKTPRYFIGVSAPERVYNMNSSIRLLLVVRDPITRLVSDYAMKTNKALNKDTSYPPLRSLVLDKNGNVDREYYAISVSTYHEHYSNWLKFFPRQQIHVVDGAKLVSKPSSELAKIENFLGIRHKITKDMFYFNETKGFYCVKDGGESSCLYKNKGRQHPDVDSDVLDKLKKYFKPLNEVFFFLAGRTFDWQ